MSCIDKLIDKYETFTNSHVVICSLLVGQRTVPITIFESRLRQSDALDISVAPQAGAGGQSVGLFAVMNVNSVFCTTEWVHLPNLGRRSIEKGGRVSPLFCFGQVLACGFLAMLLILDILRPSHTCSAKECLL